jgi:murein DD-endopeptidase MepM/ murein hydrolase activator NlpD
MTSRRTTRGGLALVLALALGLAAGAAAAPAGKVPKRIVFPVIGPAEYFAGDFGAPRPQGPHEGNDIMSVRRALAVAAEAGRVEFETGSTRGGCILRLRGDSGTEYVYIHLNNDRTNANDNRGGCTSGITFPKGLRTGDTVAAGQPVGYVGDSGDADGLQPHLHFEIHPNGGHAVDPYGSLKAAQRLLFYAPEGKPFTLALTGSVKAADPDAGTLTMAVDSLRWWPNGLLVSKLGKTLVLDSSIASVETSGALASGGPSLPAAKEGQRVTVWTAPTPATRQAQLGKPGALMAARIVLSR